MFLVYGNHNQATTMDLLQEYFLSFHYTVLVLIIPYGMMMFYFQYLKERDIGIKSIVPADHLIKIRDENDILQLAIDLEKLLFIQSTDNYVSVFYLKDDNVRKELVRTSLKKLEDDLQGTPVARCHRSYMVNLKKISVTKKTNKGMMLELKDYAEGNITVSKHYRAGILKLLQEN
jgi:DNA-binding LytR/AlgR family response regulator